jgi:hypothetical protein
MAAIRRGLKAGTGVSDQKGSSMSGNVIPARMRQKLLSAPASAERPVACAADIADRMPPSGAYPMTKSSISSAAISTRRSIAISAFALASQAGERAAAVAVVF